MESSESNQEDLAYAKEALQKIDSRSTTLGAGVEAQEMASQAISLFNAGDLEERRRVSRNYSARAANDIRFYIQIPV